MVTIEANSENKRIDVSKGSSVCSTASRTHAVYEMDQTVRVSYTPYPIKEADRFRLERLAKVSLPSKFRSEVTASDVDAIRAATKRSSLEGTRAKYATWVFGFLLGTGWILPGRLPRTDELFRTLLRRQMTPLRVTGFVGWNYATYRTG